MVLFVRSHEAAAQSLSDLLRSTPGHHGHCGHLLSSTHHRVVNTLITAVDRLAPAPTRTRPRPKAGPNPGKKKRNSKLNVQIPTGSAQQPHHHQQNALTPPGTRRSCGCRRSRRRHSPWRGPQRRDQTVKAWPTSCCCSNRSARQQRRSKAPGTGVVLKRVRPQTQARRAATHRADLVCPAPTGTTGPLFMRQPEGHRGQAPATWQHGPC